MWKDLSMQQRADLMDIYLSHGISSLEEMRNHYDSRNQFALGGNIYSGEDEPTQKMKKPVTTGGAGYIPGNYGIDIKHRLYENLSPISYDDLTRVSDAILLNKPDRYHAKMKNMPVLDEIYAQYLGIPEKDRHFNMRLEKSKYKPTLGGENVTYYKLPQKRGRNNEGTVIGDYHWRDGATNTYMDDMIFDATYMEPGTNKQQLNIELGHYTVGRGIDNNGDYVSYYDKWDLNPFSGRLQNTTALPFPVRKVLSNANMDFGTPVYIYDRIYLDDYYGVKEPTHATYLPEVRVYGKKKALGGNKSGKL